MNSILDIILLTLPRLELRSPLTAPALLKASVEREGMKALCIDLNLSLWEKLDSQKYGHLWFDTDLTFRHEDKFQSFWENILRDIANGWAEDIAKRKPKWVGMTIFSQRSKFISIYFSQLIKQKYPDIKIVFGGPYTEYFAKPLFEKKIIDAYIVGEGEEAIINLLKGSIESPGINGIAPKQIDNLDGIPIPDYSDFNFECYPKTWNDPRVKDPKKLGSEFIYITGSRGCVRKCEFCDIQNLWPKFRYRSGFSIAEEMKIQNNRFGSSRFLFTDSLLNGSIKVLKDLCQTLIEYKNTKQMKPVKWQGQFIARSRKDMPEEVFKLMKEAGCFFVSIGVESGSEKVRDDMKKMFNDEDLRYTFEMCAKYEIQMAWLMIVGYPTETEEEFQKTLELLDKYNWINEKKLIRSVALGPTLDIVPGSPLYNKHKDMNIKWDEKKNWYLGDNNRVNRIKRWLRLKQKCEELGYPIVEKATNHLLKELEDYGINVDSNNYAHYAF